MGTIIATDECRKPDPPKKCPVITVTKNITYTRAGWHERVETDTTWVECDAVQK